MMQESKDNLQKLIDFLLTTKSIYVNARPNAKKTTPRSFDESACTLNLDVKAPPEDGKANLEIIKYLSRISKRNAKLKIGKTSKKKFFIFE